MLCHFAAQFCKSSRQTTCQYALCAVTKVAWAAVLAAFATPAPAVAVAGLENAPAAVTAAVAAAAALNFASSRMVSKREARTSAA